MDERLSTMTFSCFPTCMRAIPELDQWHLSPFSFLLLSNKPDHLTSLLSPYDLFPLYVEYNARPPWSSPSLPLQHHLLLIVPLLTMPQPHSFFSNPHPRIGMFIDFREREVRGGERERSMWEGNMERGVVASCTCPNWPGIKPTTQVWTLNSNWTCHLLARGMMMLQPT